MPIYAYPGDISLNELQDQIRFAEASDLELVDCVVYADKQNQLRTACEFKSSNLPPGKLLDLIFLVPQGSPKPASGVGPLFTDSVICGNSLTVVDFYR